MPLGVLNDDEFDAELGSLEPVKAKVIDVIKGRNGSNAVPDGLRKVIAEESLNGTSPEKLKEVFDVSASSISAYKQGATSTSSYHEPDKQLKKHTDGIRDIITGKAKNKLLCALDSITNDKLKDAPIGVLANVAKSMSGVIKDMEPEEAKPIEGPNFVIYAPQFRDERSFEVIQVKE